MWSALHSDWHYGKYLKREVIGGVSEMGYLCNAVVVVVVLRFYLFFRERGREGERNICERSLPLARPQLGTRPTTQACALTWNLTVTLAHRLALDSLNHTSQGFCCFKHTRLPWLVWPLGLEHVV